MVSALAFLKSVPSWAWGLGAAVLLVMGAYLKGAADKDNEWEARLVRAEQEAAKLAAEAIKQSDEGAQQRAIAHAATQSALRKAINEAEADGANPIDVLFGSLSETD